MISDEFKMCHTVLIFVQLKLTENLQLNFNYTFVVVNSHIDINSVGNSNLLEIYTCNYHFISFKIAIHRAVIFKNKIQVQ